MENTQLLESLRGVPISDNTPVIEISLKHPYYSGPVYILVSENSASFVPYPRENENVREGYPLSQVSPMDVSLFFSNPPHLNQTAELTGVGFSQIDTLNTDIQIILPDGFVGSAGTSWNFNIARGSQIEFNPEVKAVRTGNWETKVLAESTMPNGGLFWATDFIYVSISEDNVLVGDVPFYDDSPKMGVKLKNPENSFPELLTLMDFDENVITPQLVKLYENELWGIPISFSGQENVL